MLLQNLLSEFSCIDGCLLKLSKYTLNVASNDFGYGGGDTHSTVKV